MKVAEKSAKVLFVTSQPHHAFFQIGPGCHVEKLFISGHHLGFIYLCHAQIESVIDRDLIDDSYIDGKRE
jgi:hypothetical protein